jgi:hypothetical protein
MPWALLQSIFLKTNLTFNVFVHGNSQVRVESVDHLIEIGKTLNLNGSNVCSFSFGPITRIPLFVSLRCGT